MKKLFTFILYFSFVIFAFGQSDPLKGIKWVWLDGNADAAYDTGLTVANGDTTTVAVYTTTSGSGEYQIHEAVWIIQYGIRSRVKPTPDYQWADNLTYLSRDTTAVDTLGVFTFTHYASQKILIAHWRDSTVAQSVPLSSTLPLLKLKFESSSTDGYQWVKILAPANDNLSTAEFVSYFTDVVDAGKPYPIRATNLLIKTE